MQDNCAKNVDVASSALRHSTGNGYNNSKFRSDSTRYLLLQGVQGSDALARDDCASLVPISPTGQLLVVPPAGGSSIHQ